MDALLMRYEYDAFVFQQRADGGGPQLALFHAPAAEVAAWADVDRLGPDNRLAPQREPRPSRINSIRRFFTDDVNNTIPTAIVVGLRNVAIGEAAGRSTLVFETVEGQPRPGLIIDGQHRMRGLEAVDPATVVPIVAILEATDLEMAFQFLVINNKSAKVPRDHIRALALNYPEEQLEARLKTARLALNPNLGSVGVLDEDPDSPFRGIIAWPNNPPERRLIVPAAIEAMAADAKSMGFAELEDLDSLNAFLIAMWTVIREEWAALFVENSKLLSKVGLTCMTQFICSTMKTWQRNPHLRAQVDPGDPDKVRTITSEVLATLDPGFFEADWASTSYDTRAGRDLIMADLETLSYNGANNEPWYSDLKVINQNWLRAYLGEGGAPPPPEPAGAA